MDLPIYLCYAYFLFRGCSAAPAKLPKSSFLMEPPDDPVESDDTTFFEGDIRGVEVGSDASEVCGEQCSH
ncbi:hypothetical protein BV898_19274 [Hypsibius exemplaris]|uniref:Uncharacterized protein n=1 Tax=Hypsibius exemplaris TaxID=2072580 RepID=A0A9X6NIR1_HYPEX|nr:hypothetical protein BV898_19274 [Hypsibius exemplaris]